MSEAWPVTGIDGSHYSEQKAQVERLVDRFESDHPQVRVARIRPGVVLSAAAVPSRCGISSDPSCPKA